MSTITQLILNGQVALPQTSWDKYRCYPSILNQQVEMISAGWWRRSVGSSR